MGPIAAIEQLQHALRRRLPDANITVDPPDSPDDAWWVDVKRDDRAASVEWSVQRGYGVSAPGGGYGERPDFLVADAEAAAEWIASVLAETVASKR